MARYSLGSKCRKYEWVNSTEDITWILCQTAGQVWPYWLCIGNINILSINPLFQRETLLQAHILLFRLSNQADSPERISLNPEGQLCSTPRRWNGSPAVAGTALHRTAVHCHLESPG